MSLSKQMNRFKWQVVVLSALVPLLLVACGGQNGDGTAQQTSDVEAATDAGEDTDDGATEGTGGVGMKVHHVFGATAPAAEGVNVVGEELQGEVTVDIFPAGQLGGDEDAIESLQLGNLEAGLINIGVLASEVEEYGALSLPFLFESQDEAMRVLNKTDVGDELRGLSTDVGIRILAFWKGGERSFTTREVDAATPSDLVGLKMRVPSIPPIIDFYEATGTDVVNMPFDEVYQALQTGAIDGTDTTALTHLSREMDQVSSHFTDLGYVINVYAFMVSESWWSDLDDNTQSTIRETVRRVGEEVEGPAVEEQHAKTISQLEERGSSVVEPDVEAWITMADQVYEEKWNEEYGEELLNRLRGK